MFVTLDLHLASLIQGKLEANAIPVVVLNKQDSLYGTFGEIELYVKREHVINALRLIEEDENEGT